MTPRGRAREEQVGDVRARNQQHQADDHHHRRQRPLIAIAEGGGTGRCWLELERVAQIRCLVLLAGIWRHGRFTDLRLQTTQRCGGAVDGLTRLDPHHDVEPPVRPPVERGFLSADKRLSAQRNHDIEGSPDISAKELRPCDADDRKGNPLDRQGAADDVCGAVEAPLPEVVADDGDRAVRAATAAIVRRCKRPPEDRGHAEHLEEPAARPDAVDEFGWAARRDVEACRGPRECPVKRLLTVANLLPDGVGERAVGVRATARIHDREAARDP